MIRWQNDSENWGAAAKLFHWLIAALIFGLLIVGFVMDDIEDTQTRINALQLHKSIGLVLLAVVLARFAWRLRGPVPALPPTLTGWERAGAHGAHIALYVLLFAMPVLGLLTSFASGFPIGFFFSIDIPSPWARDKDLQEFLAGLHELCAFLLVGVLLAHIGAALRHHFILRDDILRRMMPGRVPKQRS